MNTPSTQSADSLSTRVEVTVECRNLVNLDMGIAGKSDAMVIVYEGSPRNTLPGTPAFRQWVEIGRTEVVKDDLNPVFSKAFPMDYRFEELQPLRFVVMDADGAGSAETIGEAHVQLGEVAGSSGQRVIKDLTTASKGSKSRGKIVIHMQQVNENVRDILHLSFEGSKLAKKDLFSSDPYYIIKRQSPANPNDWITVHRSETIMKNLNPKWMPVSLPMSRLSPMGNLDARLRVEVWDYDKFTAHDFIGSADYTVQDLINRVSYTLKSKKGKDAGVFVVRNCSVERRFSFLDYLTHGCEVSLVAAIDWTGSNGDPHDPRSLHSINPNSLNQYEQVIRGVGSILGYYDRDQMFPVFGFGGKLPNGQVSHCFALNGSPQNPHCHGVEGIVHAYHQALRNVQLYGPTYFSEVIRATMAQAASSAPHIGDIQKYYVLLIITDGVINDMQKTIDSIVEASKLPMSIVIVGVGNADFSAMDVLDGDGKLLRSSSGVAASRDIVQFVPFNKYAGRPYQELAREVLAEIPTQLEEYFRSKGIRPQGL